MESKLELNENVKEIIENWKRANPLTCHFLGIHDYDGILPSFNAQVVGKRIEEIKYDIKLLKEKIKPTIKGKIDSYEVNLLLLALEKELFELAERKEFEDNPLAYVGPLATIEGSYVLRSFASLKERALLIIKFENNVPAFLDESASILNPSLPRVKIALSIQFLQGIINFYNGKALKDFILKCDDEEIVKTWEVVNQKAITSMQEFMDRLTKVYLPKAHNNFRLGKEKFLKLLSKQESINIDLDRLLQIGEQDLEKNYQAIKTIIARKDEDYISKMHSNYPKPEELVAYTKSTLDRTRQFLIDADIVSLPTDEQCIVMETPEYARKFAFAAMNTPGPFEAKEGNEAYYYITPPDPKLDSAQLQAHMSMFSKPALELITIHEAWPGHFLQLLYNNQSKSAIAKMFARSTSMVEGWGHYVEEMIIEEGYAPFDKDDIQFGQLTEALVRNCRYVAAIKMHCGEMTVEEATQLFKEKGFLSNENAMIEARRGTIDPMYLNYTLGKLLIKKLRSDIKTIKGENFSLKEFHNTLLSYGSPPITILRELLLEGNEQLIKEIL